MKSNSSHDLDRLIEEVLRSEPLQPVPPTFERRMQRSLQMAARVERERVQLRKRLVWRLQLVAVAVLAVAALGATAGLADLAEQAPGLMGFLDYASADALRMVGAVPGVGFATLAGSAGLAVLLFVLPLMRLRTARAR